MCFGRVDNEEVQRRVRIAGMRGLQGVVKKTYSDGIQVNVWQKEHMEKIVPSYLFNMDVSDSTLSVNLEDLDLKERHSPEMVHAVAEACFRELLCRLNSANVDTVFVPVLNYFDDHRCWTPNHFAIKVVRTIITSAQMQCSWEILRALLKHLDTHEASQPRVLTGITDVLRNAVSVVDTHFFALTFYEVFSCLVQHLRTSVVRQYSRGPNRAGNPATVDEERAFQEAIINTVVEVAHSQQLHQEQLNETISFLVGFAILPLPPASVLNGAMPLSASTARLSALQRQQEEEKIANDALCAFQRILLRAVLRIAQKYKTVNLGNALTTSILEPLVRLSQVEDRVVRYVVQRIINHLVDRRGNQYRLEMVTLINRLDDTPSLVVGEPSDADSLFAAKHGSLLLYAVYTSAAFESNHVDNVAALYATIALLALELPIGDFLLTVCALCLAIQSLARNGHANYDEDQDNESGVASLQKVKVVVNDEAAGSASKSGSTANLSSKQLLPVPHRCALHAVTASVFSLISCILPVDAFNAAIWRVIDERKDNASFLLPEMAFARTNNADDYPEELPSDDSLFFNREELIRILDAAGYRPHDLLLSAPQTRALLFASGNRHLLEGSRSLSASELSLASTTGTSESANAFLGPNRPDADAESLPPMEDLSAESIRQILRPHNISESKDTTIKNQTTRLSAEQQTQDTLTPTKGHRSSVCSVRKQAPKSAPSGKQMQQQQQQQQPDLVATLTDLLQSFSSPPPTTFNASGASTGNQDDSTMSNTLSGSESSLSDSPRTAFLSNGIPLTDIKFPEEFLYQGGSVA